MKNLYPVLPVAVKANPLQTLVVLGPVLLLKYKNGSVMN